MFERIIADRLSTFVADNDILQPQQFGFRERHTAVQQTLRIKRLVKSAKERGESSGLILLDVKNAFPSVWTEGLLAKMLRANFPSYLVGIIDKFCSNRQFYVQIGSGKSRLSNINNGTPQGSCISPILYAIFVADVNFPTGKEYALFADDTAFMAHGIQHRGIAIKLCKADSYIRRYCEKWRIQLNSQKTEVIGPKT